ncbi:MAG TPA: 5-formyltetrahydrofolate cyclo-ligase, partial [Candidatus Paceibacterota bacterium]|nr:5-formyltetrahydrofolate cyclo-ligase [Candidatus Paceibacterota bacterium]
MSGTKSTLRQTLRQRIKLLPGDQRAAASLQARGLLEQQSAWKNAKSIFFYAPVAEELDVWPLVEDSLTAGKAVCIPRYDAATQKYTARRVQNLSADLTIGQFG